MKTTYKTLIAVLCCAMALNAQAQNRTFQRNKVLIEKHTGTGCKACPSADNEIEKYIADTGNEDKVVILRHHSFRGGYLNTPCSEQISGKWYVGAWPTVLVDRYAFFGQETEAKFHSTEKIELIRSLQTIEKRMDTQTYVSLSFDGSSYDPSTRKLRLKLSGEVTKELPFLRIHAFITQDGIIKPQTTPTGIMGSYIHNDAVRDCLTSDTDGDVLTPNADGTYNVTLETTLLDKYGNGQDNNNEQYMSKTVLEDMKVVAFVSSFTDLSVSYYVRDYSFCEVHNADIIALTDLPKEAPCAAPTIEYADGTFVCASTTDGATCHYDVTPIAQTSDGQGTIDLNAPAFTVTAYADATGYVRSAKVRRTFTIRDILGEDTSDVSDVNGDGRVNKDDIEALARKILKK